MEYPEIKVGTRLYRINGRNSKEIVTITAVVREPEGVVPCGQYLFRSDAGHEGEMSQPAAHAYIRAYGTPPPRPKPEIAPGTRFYMPQAQDHRNGPIDLHAATLDHEFQSPYGPGTVWGYVCDCGFVGDVHASNVVQWTGQYGTPPPKPEPLQRLDYTEESLISDLADYPIHYGECFEHGPECPMTEFDCRKREIFQDSADVRVFFELVEKARELVKRRKD